MPQLFLLLNVLMDWASVVSVLLPLLPDVIGMTAVVPPDPPICMSSSPLLAPLGKIDAGLLPERFEPDSGLDPYRGSCETEGGVLEYLGPVVKMSKTPPALGALPLRAEAPRWLSQREDANAAQAQSA